MDGKGIIEQSSDTCIFYFPSLVQLCLTNWLDLSSLTVFGSLLGASHPSLANPSSTRWEPQSPLLASSSLPRWEPQSPFLGWSVLLSWSVLLRWEAQSPLCGWPVFLLWKPQSGLLYRSNIYRAIDELCSEEGSHQVGMRPRPIKNCRTPC